MKAIFFLMIFLNAYAEDHFSQLEVGEMSMQGNCMHLSLDFKWEHPLGAMQGKSALVYFDDTRSPQEIVMQEGLEMTLKEGGSLTSPYARLDCRLWQGSFHGHEGKKIRFEKELLSLESLQMELGFLPPNADRFVFLEKLTAEGAVEIHQSPDLYLTADVAVFDQFSPKGLFGRAALSSSCRMVQKAGDIALHDVTAEKMDVDLQNQKATLYAPQGTTQTKDATLTFKASRMIVDKKGERIEMIPPVYVEWLGTIESDGILELTLKEKELSSALFQGNTQLVWKNPLDGKEHRLTTQGTLFADPLLKEVEIKSPANALGTVNEGRQIVFKDDYGQIFADRMVLTFNQEEGHLKPLKIFLEGNVRLQNNQSGALQYALADAAIFEFGQKTLMLQSKTRPRVLFYDELNKVQASAPGLLINRDPKTGQDVLKGLGNVRFIFAEDELNELKKRFSFEPKK